MFDQLTILAPGLLGSSVARAARARGVARRIVLWARRPEVREALAKERWCDAVEATPESAAAGASLVVIASLVDTIIPLAIQIGPHLPPGCHVTDVGSVKGRIARRCQAAVGPGSHFVGAHPMAGSEKTGWEHGLASLFENRTCFVTPLPETAEAAFDVVAGFWRELGARVVKVDPDSHDTIVAAISHLPQLTASALCSFLAGKDVAWRSYAGGGLRDTTRIAASDSNLWKTILQENRLPALAALRGFKRELGRVEKALAAEDWDAVVDLLRRGKDYRDGME